jgi:hypothetical protein
MSTEREEHLAGEPIDAEDLRILDTIAAIHRANDPVPADLADRVRFAMSMAALEAEIADLTTLPMAAAGTRGGSSYELARTVTFSGEHLTAMITIESVREPVRRVAGWVDNAAVRVELRTPAGTHSTTTDAEGRFAFDAVRPGLVHLVLWRTDLADGRPLMTPPMEI